MGSGNRRNQTSLWALGQDDDASAQLARSRGPVDATAPRETLPVGGLPARRRLTRAPGPLSHASGRIRACDLWVMRRMAPVPCVLLVLGRPAWPWPTVLRVLPRPACPTAAHSVLTTVSTTTIGDHREQRQPPSIEMILNAGRRLAFHQPCRSPTTRCPGGQPWTRPAVSFR